MESLSIISQNLGANPSVFSKSKSQIGHKDYMTGRVVRDDILREYMEWYDADIYAFQNAPLAGNRSKAFTGFRVRPDELRKYRGAESDHDVKAIWREAFPWIEFKSGYWMEKKVEFDGEEIIIINYHCASNYSVQLRYILLKRLDQESILDKCVILLGDFNTVFNFQTERVIK